MFGCCNKAMGVTYITDEGEIEPEYLQANYPEGSKIVAIQDSMSRWGKLQFKSRGEFPVSKKVVSPDGEIHEICWCPCHGGPGAAIMC